MSPTFAAAADLFGAGLGENQQALLRLALDFATWRILSQSHSYAAAARLMSEAIERLDG
jgi:hypothetical protein